MLLKMKIPATVKNFFKLKSKKQKRKKHTNHSPQNQRKSLKKNHPSWNLNLSIPH
ncbi:hypothetical protein PIB30_104123 [Stylosanthes scabra]|uniref:Uncharacterized protein n=1 Tax=Stylosanthes scabra TaxID=79078 RepID=A0ABU6ZWR6_9FABA|nr:hypothetical protein [Stylosanthes scabra]